MSNRPSRLRRRPTAVVAAALGLAVATTGSSMASPQDAAPGDQAPECQVEPINGRQTGLTALTAHTTATAAGVEFFLDGETLGYGFTEDAGPGTTFDYAAYGTLDQGWATASVANGQHQLSCRAWNEASTGDQGSSTAVRVHNRVNATMITPLDDGEVTGIVELVAEFSGPGRLPRTATFTLDGEELGTADCVAYAKKAVRCSYDWDTPATTSEIDWEIAMGLRVIAAHAEVPGAEPHTAPIRTFVNNRPGSELILSAYERAGLGRVGRDGGWSVTLPGDPSTDFVTFGDGVYRPITGPEKEEFTVGRFGNTSVVTPSGEGLYEDFQEVPNLQNDPVNAPALTPVVPTPGLLKAPDGTDCDAEHSISWSTGVVAKPASDNLLMTYWSMCSAGGELHLQAYGIAEWDPTTHTAVTNDVFVQTPDLPSQMQLASPSREGDYLYFWRPDTYAMYLARVKVAGDDVVPNAWNDPEQYEYKDGSSPTGWTNDPLAAENVLPESERGGFPSSILRATNLPGEPMLLISHPDVWDSSVVSVYVAYEPGDPWQPVEEWQNVTVCEPCGPNGVYVVYSHPERSTDEEMLVTFTDRTSGRVMQQLWEIPESLR